MKSLDVILCMDRNFILGAGALIASLLKHNPDIEFIFHLFTKMEDITVIDSELFGRLKRNLSEHSNFKYQIYDVSKMPLYEKLRAGGLNARKIIQAVRVFAPSYCKTVSNRLLYLDADIICLGNISEVFDLELDNKTFAAAPWHEKTDEPFLEEGKYPIERSLCAGVLLIDVKRWKQDNAEQKLVDFIIKKKPKFTDQTALNVIYDKEYKILSNRYNSFNRINSDTLFLHYVSLKLWEPWNFNVSADILCAFRTYAKLFEPDVTKWVTFRRHKKALVNLSAYENPESRFASKWMYKQMLKRRKFYAFICFLLLHIYIKIKHKGIIGLLLLKSNTGS